MLYRILKRHDAHFELQYLDSRRRWESATRDNPFGSELAVYEHMITKGLDAETPPDVVLVDGRHGGLTGRV